MTATPHPVNSRLWEIDLLRGVAVIMMVVFHIVFDLSYLSIVPILIYSGFWRYFALLTALIFVSLSGVSLHLSHQKATKIGSGRMYGKFLRRGTEILLIGLVITFVTYFVIGEGYIIFGVLHCIGTSILLAPLFIGRPKVTLVAAILVISGGFFISRVSGPLWLVWLGIHPASFQSLDYFPLLPWFGVVLLGLTLGTYLYPFGRRIIPLWDRSPNPVQPVCWLGRHSLVIYLVHQPVILLVFALLFPGSIWFLP